MNIGNILQLGIKELRGLWRDPMMLLLVAYAFTFAVYQAATALPETLNKAAVAIVDEDRSPLSARIIGAFYPPHFLRPVTITRGPKRATAFATSNAAPRPPPENSSTHEGSNMRCTRSPSGKLAWRRPTPKRRPQK